MPILCAFAVVSEGLCDLQTFPDQGSFCKALYLVATAVGDTTRGRRGNDRKYNYDYSRGTSVETNPVHGRRFDLAPG